MGSVVLNLRKDAFDAVLARDMSFYDEFATGKIVSRVTSDTQDFSNTVTLTLNLMSQLLLIGIITIVLFNINARLHADHAGGCPRCRDHGAGFPPHRAADDAAGAESAGAGQLHGAGIGDGDQRRQNFRREQTIYDEFQDVNKQSYALNLRQGFVFSGIFPVLGILEGLGTALIVYFGGLFVLGDSISPGEWFLFVEAGRLFWFPLTSIASFWSQFQLGLSASERVFALVDAEPRVTQSCGRAD